MKAKKATEPELTEEEKQLLYEKEKWKNCPPQFKKDLKKNNNKWKEVDEKIKWAPAGLLKVKVISGEIFRDLKME